MKQEGEEKRECAGGNEREGDQAKAANLVARLPSAHRSLHRPLRSVSKDSAALF